VSAFAASWKLQEETSGRKEEFTTLPLPSPYLNRHVRASAESKTEKIEEKGMDALTPPSAALVPL